MHFGNSTGYSLLSLPFHLIFFLFHRLRPYSALFNRIFNGGTSHGLDSAFLSFEIRRFARKWFVHLHYYSMDWGYRIV